MLTAWRLGGGRFLIFFPLRIARAWYMLAAACSTSSTGVTTSPAGKS